MKKYLIFSILSLVFIASFPAQAIKRINANPINIASRLVLQQDSAEIASTLEYYGYSHTPNTATQSPILQVDLADTDGFAVFSHPDGSIIRFYYPKTEDKQKYPTVQVKSNSLRVSIEKIMDQLQYKKTGDHYENVISKYSTHLTKCTFGPGNLVTFQRLRK